MPKSHNQRRKERKQRERTVPIVIGSYRTSPGAKPAFGKGVMPGKSSIRISNPTMWATIENIARGDKKMAKKKFEMDRKRRIASVYLGMGGAEMLDNIKLIAENWGMTVSDLFLSALAFYIRFDTDFLSMAGKLAKDLESNPSFVIKRLAIAHWAEMAAEEEIAGQPIPKALLEFTPGLEALEFYDFWKAKRVQELKPEPEVSQAAISAQDKIMKDYLQGLPPDKRAEVERNIEKQQEWLKEHNKK